MILQQVSIHKPLLILLLILGLPFGSLCQNSVSENVSDGSVSISFARITLFNDDLSFFRETRTNNDGNFSLTNISNGNYTLGATALGKKYLELPLTLTGDVNDLNFTLGTEVHPGNWQTIMNSPEPLGGTDFGVLLPDGKIFYCHSSEHPFLFDPVENDTVFMQGDTDVQGCVAPGLILDGRLIFVGGTDQETYGPGTRLVKIFNPLDESWEDLPKMLDYRWYPSMTQLPNGQLLVIGGGGLDNPVRVKTSEIYDPYNLTVEQVEDIEIGNEISPIVLLYSGEVLMTHRPPQLFNPITKEWRLAADFV